MSSLFYILFKFILNINSFNLSNLEFNSWTRNYICFRDLIRDLDS